MGALDRLAKLKRQKLKEIIDVPDYTRTETNGWIIYRKGEDLIKVNPIEDYRNTLIALLDKAGGDPHSQVVLRFWNNQAEKLVTGRDEMHSRALQDIYDRLGVAWEQIWTPPEPDFFAEFE